MYSLNLPDIVAALATIADVIGEGFVALTLGFAVKATGLGFLVGAVLLLALKSVVPISFEVESLTVVSRLAKRDWEKMCQIILTAGILGAILGMTGVYTNIVGFIEGPILAGMMTGVGVILSFVAFDIFKENKIIGGVSIGSALLTFFIFIKDPNNLIYALAVSVIAGIIASRFVKFDPIEVDLERERIRLIPLNGFRFLKDITVIRGALALLALRTGTSIAYSGIDGQMANTTPNVDHTNIIAGIGGAISGLFGGAPIEPIISGTAAAPHPVASGALMMAVVGVLLLMGFFPKLARYIPVSAVSGFLFVLGAVLAIPGNIGGVITPEDAFSGPITVVVTAASFDPFLGMVAGVLVRLLAGIMG
ncbi:MAG: NCS2 family permease [Peptococcaceae bacterium]|nr:NCS2 family permease [Peptococcaceae bacterium]